ncbi:tyrosine--tRNA ligase [Prevotella fusca JCM 17724]|uniref:Tyrosine--tRNA ligase n=1 Tax=Prevotella fusca JCM 17724 TaxID=1236517 RepID=A0A0K1NKK9_9BACT|nr:tyrosine--tRNA ligase [Prevotella fusca]AKU69565.1 tyrosyl-tRNA synthetase [Prevotella fusca JCM 17724]QUB87208.1 tyrosine--tRNA ligase [Prevotella fusca JCM 17724]
MKNFVEELRWRGMLAQMMPGTEEMLQKEMVSAYLGTDPTADSLHIGHLCGIMMLRHLQRCGHKPYLLVGGATGMIGDPSGKSQERNLLDAETLYHNQEAIKKQVSKFLDFDGNEPNKAEMVNNYDWMKDFTFLDFARLVGKHITVNYMMAKDSVKKRLSGEARDGLSFTEFTYQLLQGYDFLYLYDKFGVKLQLGGNDQWGNMTTGTELIRRTLSNEAEAYCLTCPLITKADGKKFGKTESGNIWLDRNRTTPYAFYQFWLNVSDDDAEKYIKIFTSLEKDVIDSLVEEHRQDPGRRTLQYRLAEEVTRMVHSQEDLDMAIAASNILFGKSTKENLLQLDEQTFADVFKDVPHYEVSKDVLGQPAVDVFNQEGMQIFPSKSEMRKLVKGGGVALNKEKLAAFDQPVTAEDLIDGKYLLVQKGKKNYSLIIVK